MNQYKDSEEYRQLEVLSALLESKNDEVVKSIVQRINLSRTPLSNDGAHVVSSIMSRCGKMDVVALQNVSDELIRIMCENLKGKPTHVSLFHDQYSVIFSDG